MPSLAPAVSCWVTRNACGAASGTSTASGTNTAPAPGGCAAMVAGRNTACICPARGAENAKKTVRNSPRLCDWWVHLRTVPCFLRLQ